VRLLALLLFNLYLLNALSYVSPIERVTLNGDYVQAQQLYNGKLYGAAPDYTPVPDQPCIVTYAPLSGLKETCYPSLYSSLGVGVIEDLRVVDGMLYATSRHDTSYGDTSPLELLKYGGAWSVVATLGKDRWGAPYVALAKPLMAPLSGGRFALLVTLNDAWRTGSTEDVRLVIVNEQGDVIKDVSLVPPLRAHGKRDRYSVAGYGDYALVAQAWEEGSGVGYTVVAYNARTSKVKVLDKGHIENLYTLVVSRIYNVRGWNGKEYVAIYYLLKDGTLVLKVYDPWGLKRELRKALPFEVLDGRAFACCVPNKVWFSFIASDGGFYIPLTLKVNMNGNAKYVNVLVGQRGVYVYDNVRESWGTSVARVSGWGKVIVSGCDACGEGYAYVLPDPKDPIKLERSSTFITYVTTITTVITLTLTVPVTVVVPG